jgi:hypothetical protein
MAVPLLLMPVVDQPAGHCFISMGSNLLEGCPFSTPAPDVVCQVPAVPALCCQQDKWQSVKDDRMEVFL